MLHDPQLQHRHFRHKNAANALLKSAKRYVKKDDTMVEDFKEWKHQGRQKNKAAEAIIGSFWLIAVCVYIVVSFMTGAWHITWIIFLIAAAIASMIRGLFMLKQ